MLFGWTGKLRRAMQTEPDAQTASGAAFVRKRGTAAAYRRTAAMYLMVQVLLWANLTGIPLAERGVWQSAILLIPAGLGVWALSRWAWGGQDNPYRQTGADAAGDNRSTPGNRHRLRWFSLPGANRGSGTPPNPVSAPSSPGEPSLRRPWELLLFLPCLLLDSIYLLNVLLSLLHRLMPSYPIGILRVCIPGLLLLAVWLGKRNGVAYGVSLWRWLLPLMAVWVLVHVLRDQGTEQLYPLAGNGLYAALDAWAAGLGALWPAGLLFILPNCGGSVDSETGKPAPTVQYVLAPLLLGVLCALTLAASACWHMAEEASAGFRLLLPGRSGGSMMISGLWALFWLLSLMTGWCTLLMGGQKILQRVFPRWNAPLTALLPMLPAAGLLWFWPGELPGLLHSLMPWRLLLWALAAAWAVFRRIRCKHRQGRAGGNR